MKFTFTGKNVVVSDQMKEQATKKIGRLSKLLPETADIVMTFSAVKQDNIVEVSIALGGRSVRAQTTGTNWTAAIDEVADILERQMIKYRKRYKDKMRRGGSIKDVPEVLYSDSDDIDLHADEPASIKIERIKTFALKPMDEEEAVMEMELLGHIFYVFRNAKSGLVNVVYKRKDGAYGLICPQDQ